MTETKSTHWTKADFLSALQVAKKLGLTKERVYNLMLSMYKHNMRTKVTMGTPRVMVIKSHTSHKTEKEGLTLLLAPYAYDSFLEQYYALYPEEKVKQKTIKTDETAIKQSVKKRLTPKQIEKANAAAKAYIDTKKSKGK